MLSRFFFSVLFCGISALLWGQNPTLNQLNLRPATSLNGHWKYIVDPYENGFYNYRYEPFEAQTHPGNGAFFSNAKAQSPSDLIEYDFDLSDSLRVPGDWNTQRERLFYYEGSLWYKKSFDYEKLDSDKRVFIHFGASNYETDVYCNGKKVGKHVGGFTPFHFELSALLRPKDNFLVVKVDNKRRKEGVPTLNTDWWNYGGLTRDVQLIETPQTFIGDYFLQLNPENEQQMIGYVQLTGPAAANQRVTLEIPELELKETWTTNQEGRIEISFFLDDLLLWSPQYPTLYNVSFSTQEDTIRDQIGFRTIKTEGSQILLNGQPIFLKGISLHEESPFGPGRGHSEKDARQLLEWAKELGCNYLRLAHYPHNEHMVRLADQMGLLIWEENPVYWTIDWENPSTLENARNQLTELIGRDKNRASVIIWSMANETPNSGARNQFLGNLAQHARQLDATRLISAALEQKDVEGKKEVRTIADPFAEVVDVLSFNQYIGWYDGLPDKCQRIQWEITQDKPVIISEFGAGAKQGYHGDAEMRWTEEYQEELYLQTLQMIDRIDQLAGVSPWILVDFRSPRRVLPKIQDGWNRKGLISEDGVKKKAFFILQSYYQSKR